MSTERPEVDRPIQVLFLCTGNSARSILAEAILNRFGGEGLRASSAGSQPKAAPHAMTLETLNRLGYETESLRSKSWDEFAGGASPALDLIITVCGNAAGETCPIWPGHPITGHWDIEDPAAFSGSEQAQRAFFETIHDELRTKIRRIVDLEKSMLSERTKSVDDRNGRVEQLGAAIFELGRA